MNLLTGKNPSCLSRIIRLTIISIFIVMLFFSGLPGKAAVTASGENWLSGWENRIKMTIDYSERIEATLTDFPVLVYLSAESGINGDDVTCVFDELQSDANREKIAISWSRVLSC